jgi:hypothetical protein
MKSISTRAALAALTIVAVLAGQLSTGAASAAVPTNFADEAFKSLWTRTDSLVESGRVPRSWYWGPQPNTGPIMEDYAEGPGGKHLVQYFDKTRMEINNPGGDKSNPFYVTNGLLTRELITGYMQTGNNKFVLRWPAQITIAGDPIAASITYASFRGAIERTDENAVGKIVIAMVSWTGSLDFEHGAKAYMDFEQHGVKNAYYEPATKHNIPDVFWTFLNSTGLVVVNGRQVTARLNDPYFYATGYPIADAYWTRTLLGGKSTDVLVQPYERRVLTYVPTNPTGFKVEMGNVGQHYYDWRYKDGGKPEALAGRCSTSPVLGFGKLYAENDLVKIELGCASDAERRATVTRQPFENGEMIGVTALDFYTGRNYMDVYVLFKGGTAKTYAYSPTDQVEEPTLPAPPAGRYVPRGNFAMVWSLMDNGRVREQLGWATAPAEVAATDPNGTGGGILQYFRAGLMVYPSVQARKIYVLYNTSGDRSIVRGPHLTINDIDRWAVYDDTYTP